MSWLDAVLRDSGIAASIKLINYSVGRHSEIFPSGDSALPNKPSL
jgi:hypothetical protein